MIFLKTRLFGWITSLREMPGIWIFIWTNFPASPEWAGRRHHLSEIPLGGNGEITMKDKATGQVIYRTSFSSLFQEWVTEEEASRVRKGFENSFLLPYPKKEAVVTVALKNVYHKVSTSLTHEVNPNDILIHQRGLARITPHRYLLQSGSSKDCIDVAIMAEGYTEQEMDLFYKDAQTACDALFSHEPFKKLKNKLIICIYEFFLLNLTIETL